MERLIIELVVLFLLTEFIFQVDTLCINVSILTWYCNKGI